MYYLFLHFIFVNLVGVFVLPGVANLYKFQTLFLLFCTHMLYHRTVRHSTVFLHAMAAVLHAILLVCCTEHCFSS